MNLSKKVMNSGLNREAFNKKCRKEDAEELGLIKVIVTRWYSHAMCLLRILTMQPAVSALCTDRSLPDLTKYAFTSDEWTILEQMELTLKVSGLLYI